MRKNRILGAPGAIYHVTSRILEKRFLLNDQEKERFRNLQGQLADFCGIRILTHCLMDNHFHILLEVPPRPLDFGPEIIARQLDHLPIAPSSARTPGEQFRCELEFMRRHGCPEDQVEAFCETFRARTFDLSRFMQELKQRFTQDYNRRHQRKGPLWEERFKSVLLEADAEVLLRVAAYIDLNPLRAGICNDPKDYRFCGYAGAVAGDDRCLAGLKRLCELMDRERIWERGQALSAYRVALFGDAKPREAKNGKTARAGASPEHIATVLRVRGELPLHEVLTVRLRYLSEGLVLGRRIFVEDLTQRVRRENRLSGRFAPRPVEWDNETLFAFQPHILT